MGIDTMVFAASFAAATYTKGTIVPMKLIEGPVVVRDGRGPAKLKRIVSFTDGSPGSGVSMPLNAIVQNANWIDAVVNPCHLYTDVMFQNGKAVQNGGDCPLVVNSGFDVNLEIKANATSTSAFDAFVLIDIEYGDVPAVADPEKQAGTPCTVEKEYAIMNTASGSVEASGIVWSSTSIDIFKAGYKYVLTDAFVDSLTSNAGIGFLSITDAASQMGLKRIIPLVTDAGFLPLPLLYSEVMVKGPMTLNLAAIGSAAITADVQLDFIRR